MPHLAPGRSRVRAAVIFTLIGLAQVSSANAGTATSPFRLATGHAARQELCFRVGGPGPVTVVVDPGDVTGPLHVALAAGPTVVHSVQGEGRVAFTVDATRAHLQEGEEWAVTVMNLAPDQRGTGRITVTFPDAPRPTAHAADAWIRAHPAVGFHMVWNEAGRPLPYSVWPAAMQRRLWTLWDEARAGGPGTVPDPPPNAWRTLPGDDPATVHSAFTPAVARELYLSTLAHILAAETERRVPWSLDDLNGDELEALVASASMFWWNADQQAYEISEFDHGWAVPASPQATWRFLQAEGLLRPTRLETITALVAWARNLTHFAGPVSRENFVEHWGYDGDMPVSRALAGTRYTGTAFQSLPGYDTVRHYTAGCQGTVGLLLSVLRAANIPSRPRSVSDDNATHATLLLLTEDRALSHGDDPYSPMTEGASPQDLLVSLDAYNTWLGPRAKDPARNIGRQALAIGLARLPPIVRRAHELDRQQGLAPEQSAVFALFRGTFTMQELMEAKLWDRLASADAMGGTVASAHDSADEGWLEAESVQAYSTAGTVETEAMQELSAGQWRNDRQLRWRDGKPGTDLVLPFSVPAEGRYRLSVRFTRAPDYGIVTIRLGDNPTVLDRVSLYAPQMLAADPLPLGTHALAAGSHRLVFTIVGTHPDAVPAFGVGIDAVRIERLR